VSYATGKHRMAHPAASQREHQEALGLWWPRVERNLLFLARKHEVRTYPDGSRAVVCGDLVASRREHRGALKVWYRGLSRG